MRIQRKAGGRGDDRELRGKMTDRQVDANGEFDERKRVITDRDRTEWRRGAEAG